MQVRNLALEGIVRKLCSLQSVLSERSSSHRLDCLNVMLVLKVS